MFFLPFSHLTAVGLRLVAGATTPTGFSLQAHAIRPWAMCPTCQRRSRSLHSHYSRTLRDLPWGDRALTIQLRLRRFRCRTRRCGQHIFCERIPDLAGAGQRRTRTFSTALERVGFALGGAAGARLARVLRLPTSRSTLLRVITRTILPPLPAPRIIGIDDFAFRKGHRYGTIVVDLERHQVIDLLPDRQVETVSTWLAAHPTIEVVSRDRSPAYAEAATRGAPQARQVADRFHLVKNAREVLERYLGRYRAVVAQAAVAAPPDPSPDAAPLPPAADAAPAVRPRPLRAARREQPQAVARRTERQAQITAIRAAHAAGMSIRAIARTYGMSPTTIRTYIRLSSDPTSSEAVVAHAQQRPSCLDPFKPYLEERWAAGVHNAHQLWEELVARGFRGSKTTVRDVVATWRTTPAPRGRWASRVGPLGAPPRVQRYTVRQTMWLLVADSTTWTTRDRAYLRELFRLLPDLLVVQTLILGFLAMVQNRITTALQPWLRVMAQCGYPDLQVFGAGLARDVDAVTAALEIDWSNGMVEGQVNRLKMVKRTMFGRAGFALLRQRMLDPGALHQEWV